jgi:dihydroorotase
MSSVVVIRNATIVNEGTRTEGDILLKNGRIEQIGGSLAVSRVEHELEAAGLFVLPGLIDDQVHFREPGLSHKATIASESRAALAGGITSFMDMPNVKPPTTTHEAFANKLAHAAETSRANYGFYFGATNDNLEAVKRVDPAMTCGIKIFMGSSTGNMLVDETKVLEGIFAHAPTLVATHCEDTPMIKANEATARERFGEDVPFSEHPVIRDAEACYASSSLAVSLAKKHDTRLHILHLTTAKELSLFEAGPVTDKRITAEACVHHLWFCDEDYERLGASIKCNPAIKSAADRAAIQQAVLDDVIDVIATDHAPHTAEEKGRSYFQAPSGLPLVQHSLLSLLEHVHDGRFSLEVIAKKASHAVAELFSIRERGFVREGYWGDLVLVDMNATTPVTSENVLYKCGWSPFEGYTFRSRVVATLMSGQLAYHNGKVFDDIRGQALAYDRDGGV